MSSNFTQIPGQVAKFEAFTYAVTGIQISVSELTLAAAAMALLILCLKAPIFDTGR